MFNVDVFKKKPVMGIVRGIKIDVVDLFIESVIKAGLETIEITMNTVGAVDIISNIVKKFKNKISIGAGTVLNKKDLNLALKAGASFIVSPILSKDIVSFCVKEKIPVFPGALTPKEVLNAWDMGASMVKLFPSYLFGPKYIKELKAPLDKVQIIAVGGVRVENIDYYFACGVNAIGIGSSVFKKEWIENMDFLSIENLLKKYIDKTVNNVIL